MLWVEGDGSRWLFSRVRARRCRRIQTPTRPCRFLGRSPPFPHRQNKFCGRPPYEKERKESLISSRMRSVIFDLWADEARETL